jgi:hypothetical protein
MAEQIKADIEAGAIVVEWSIPSQNKQKSN